MLPHLVNFLLMQSFLGGHLLSLIISPTLGTLQMIFPCASSLLEEAVELVVQVGKRLVGIVANMDILKKIAGKRREKPLVLSPVFRMLGSTIPTYLTHHQPPTPHSTLSQSTPTTSPSSMLPTHHNLRLLPHLFLR